MTSEFLPRLQESILARDAGASIDAVTTHASGDAGALRPRCVFRGLVVTESEIGGRFYGVTGSGGSGLRKPNIVSKARNLFGLGS